MAESVGRLTSSICITTQTTFRNSAAPSSIATQYSGVFENSSATFSLGVLSAGRVWYRTRATDATMAATMTIQNSCSPVPPRAPTDTSLGASSRTS